MKKLSVPLWFLTCANNGYIVIILRDRQNGTIDPSIESAFSKILPMSVEKICKENA